MSEILGRLFWSAVTGLAAIGALEIAGRIDTGHWDHQWGYFGVFLAAALAYDEGYRWGKRP